MFRGKQDKLVLSEATLAIIHGTGPSRLMPYDATITVLHRAIVVRPHVYCLLFCGTKTYKATETSTNFGRFNASSKLR